MADDSGTDALLAEARAWAGIDPDPETRAEVETLLRRAEAGDSDAGVELRESFGGRLRFGTAGLRARLGAGPRRMNRLVVAQSSAGFAAFLRKRAEHAEAQSPPAVVVGYDARVNSDVFARDAAEVLAGAGLAVTLLPEPLPTPVTAFAVRHLGAAAGVMITASHNPPGDNGYKVYLGGEHGGAQLVSPHDREITGHIERVLAEDGPLPPRDTGYRVAGPEILDAYVAATAGASRRSGSGATRHGGSGASAGSDAAATPIVVYTAMHGVGARTARRVFAEAGLPEVVPVAEQDLPDGGFPTVRYPNPEEPDALDLAFALARERGADYVLAHDPDADRLALAAPHPEAAEGYRRLSGNELGLLLGWRAAERERLAAGREGRTPRGTLANTIVSSPALGAVARAYGLDHAETLPGFKWVARVPELLFGFEEALGYLTDPDVLGDKDGVSAGAEALALACELHAAGRTIWQLLDEASERFGYFASAQIVLRRDRIADVEALSARIRERPPVEFAGIDVVRVRDFRTSGLAPAKANILAYDLADGSRVMIRPSGTEPKLKVYLDASSEAASAAEGRADTEAVLGEIESAVRVYLVEADGPDERGAGS